ncbi:MAG TPA: 50S ribosomal protein L30 [Candidatus Limnocylindrales bacterium]|jgi:large subunit ribosomal protein L30|nr:50S ribosomal protein L30 [Candidatus Limnocylindrales bacterium]
MPGRLRVTLRKSPISTTAKARGTVRALGLRRIGHSVDVPDTPVTRGMARAIGFLVEVEELERRDEPEASARKGPRTRRVRRAADEEPA